MAERRLDNRMLCSEVVDVEWKDRSGWTRTTTALLEDISACGALLQMEVPVPARAELRIHHNKGWLPGEVRYCAYREIGYFIGLQFIEEHRWSKRLFRPKHLMDPLRLARR